MTYSPGQKLTGIPAAALNAAMELSKRGPGRSERPLPGIGARKVKNNSGSIVPAGGVLGIDDVVETTDAGTWIRSLPTLDGVVPTASHQGKFVIARQGIAAGDIGPCTSFGEAVAQVDVTDEDHAYADVKVGDVTQLSSATSGGAQILWKESGTGTKWALIRIDGVQGTYAAPHDLTYTGEHQEAARTDTYTDDDSDTVLWSRHTPPTDKDGVKVTVQLGAAYYHTGDEKLYAYVADMVFDSFGSLVKILEERRVEIDTPEAC